MVHGLPFAEPGEEPLRTSKLNTALGSRLTAVYATPQTLQVSCEVYQSTSDVFLTCQGFVQAGAALPSLDDTADLRTQQSRTADITGTTLNATLQASASSYLSGKCCGNNWKARIARRCSETCRRETQQRENPALCAASGGDPATGLTENAAASVVLFSGRRSAAVSAAARASPVKRGWLFLKTLTS